MEDAIRLFRNNYAEQFTKGISTFLGLYGRQIIQQIHEAIVRPRCTIYLFGNGGSHSITKCMEYALQAYAVAYGLSLRVQTGVDIHQRALLESEDSCGISFVHVLETEGADSRDLVVLISGSGNSDNLCKAASYTKHRAIPTIALIGSSRGKLKDFVSAPYCFCTPIEDQQISEDIIQSIAYFLSHPVSDLRCEEWKRIIAHEATRLLRAIQQIPASWISTIAEEIVDTFFCRKKIWILGLDNPVFSVCAEHTAHNLYWDSIYQVENPPQRLIWSSPTSCDFSGITNDRRRNLLSLLTGLTEGENIGVVILYSMTLKHQALQEFLERLDSLNIPVFIFSADADITPNYRNISIYKTELKEPQPQAGVSQILGHILGRIVRMRLMERHGSQVSQIARDPAHFLIHFDLAQRRLLDGRG